MSSVLEKLRAKVKEKIERKASKQKGHGIYNLPDGVEFFKPQKAGTYHIDILPYRITSQNHPQVSSGEIWYERTVFIHFNIGDEQLAYICPKTIGKKCPICEHRAKLMKDADADEDLIRALKPKERQLFNVIDLDEREQKIKIWEVSNFLFGEFLEEEIINGDSENASFFFYEGGKTLSIRFKQESFGDNAFLKTHRIDFEDRDDYGEEILKETIDLDKILIILSYEELEKKFLGIEDKDIEISSDKEDIVKDDYEISKEEEKPVRRFSRRIVDEETKQEKPIRKSIRKTIEKDEEGDEKEQEQEIQKVSEKCPAGGKFGEDCNNLKECDTCDIWESCQDKNDEIRSNKIHKKR